MHITEASFTSRQKFESKLTKRKIWSWNAKTWWQRDIFSAAFSRRTKPPIQMISANKLMTPVSCKTYYPKRKQSWQACITKLFCILHYLLMIVNHPGILYFRDILKSIIVTLRHSNTLFYSHENTKNQQQLKEQRGKRSTLAWIINSRNKKSRKHYFYIVYDIPYSLPNLLPQKKKNLFPLEFSLQGESCSLRRKPSS